MTSIAAGNRRLLRLAKILDTADAEHKRRKEPRYDQSRFEHECNTPACAIGHWAFHNRKRWGRHYGDPVLNGFFNAFDSAMQEFSLKDGEDLELFDVDGCGGAKTAKEAAAYIRAFVKRRQKEARS